jgi:uncharacterized protein (DUF2141 family)
MRLVIIGLVLLLLVTFAYGQQQSAAKSASVAPAAAASKSADTPAAAAKKGYTLTIQVEGVNKDAGTVGVLVFSANSLKGWPEDRFAALKDIVVPAHPGTVTVTIPDLAPGDYGVALVHDVNQNHKVDKNFLGMPKEQWGMSNNPHATVKAPSFAKAKFTLDGDKEIHVTLQQ